MSDRQRDGSASSAEIEDAVILYLRNHPDAADTLDGIVDWWLPQQRYEIARSRIERVLDRLVGAGLLRRDNLPGGSELYALNDAPDEAPNSH